MNQHVKRLDFRAESFCNYRAFRLQHFLDPKIRK